MKLNVTINTDDKYIQHAMVMLCSLFENNKKHSITVHVLQKCLSKKSHSMLVDLTKKYENIIYFYDVDETPLQGVQFRSNRPLSMAAYYRLLLSSVLPNSIDSVLYLDCDMIVVSDISSIFNIEMDKYPLAASLDNSPYTSHHREQLQLEVGEKTFCSGLMMVNLKYWRDNNCEIGLLEYAKRHRDIVYLHDQDVLNYYFKKKWFALPPKWNRNAYDLKVPNYPGYKKFDFYEYLYSPKIIHFADSFLKPWNKGFSDYKYLYKKYLKLSGFENPNFTEIKIGKKIYALRVMVANKIRLNFFLYFKYKNTL